MTNLKQLERDLWAAADQMRTNSKLMSAEYQGPNLIFLWKTYNCYFTSLENLIGLAGTSGKGNPRKVRKISLLRFFDDAKVNTLVVAFLKSL